MWGLLEINIKDKNRWHVEINTKKDKAGSVIIEMDPNKEVPTHKTLAVLDVEEDQIEEDENLVNQVSKESVKEHA